MLTPEMIQSLPELAAPVLSVYLDTNQSKQMNRGLKPGYLTKLDSLVKAAGRSVPTTQAEEFHKQAKRVAAYLRGRRLRGKGVVIFAGAGEWEATLLPLEVENEVDWGAPSLGQWYWLLDEHKPCGVVIVGQKGAQFFRYQLGELVEGDTLKFRLAPVKEKEMGKVSRPHVRMSRGTNRDAFERHVAADYAHYHRQIGERIERWFVAEHLQSVFVVGLNEMAKGALKELPAAVRDLAVPVDKDFGWMTRAELQRRLVPLLEKHERERDVAIVDALLAGSGTAVVGLDEALVQLQKGTLRSVVVAKGLQADLLRCGECLWTDHGSDARCPACGGERHAVTFRGVFPELARRYNVSLKVVSGEAARKLQAAGGMGGWLNERGRKEYGQRQTFA
jgi:release factor family 10